MMRRIAVLLALVVAGAAGACKENIDNGVMCPTLCPAQKVVIRDTVIDPVLVFDSTFVGYPERGQEQAMLLATRGDTLETRGVIRFDQLVTIFTPTGDTARSIVHLDSSKVRLILDRTGAKIPSQVRFDVYDVDDSTAADTSAAAVLTQFRPSKLIGSRTVLKDSLTDTLFIHLADSAVLDKILKVAHLRVGIRVSGTGSVSLRAQTVETSGPAILSYRPSLDTTVAPISVSPFSLTPTGNDFPEIRSDMQDFTLVAKYNLPQTPNTMAVGGMPGRRTYLRFNVPRYITDSTTVIRATLRLTQRPVRFGDISDTLTVHAHVVLANPQVTDLRRAVNILSAPGLLVLDSLLVTPIDSGVRTIDMYSLLRAWGTQVALINAPPHALVLRASPESVSPMEARFFSTTAAPALRPTMRISYIPKTQFGIP